jgi:hypothetical protein
MTADYFNANRWAGSNPFVTPLRRYGGRGDDVAPDAPELRELIDAARALLDGLGRNLRPECLFDLEEALERALAAVDRRRAAT